MKNIQLDRTVKQYILDAINSEPYEVEAKTEKEKLQFLFSTFSSEYGFAIDHYGITKAFEEWIKGLPSAFNIDFENYKILELAKAWGSFKGCQTQIQHDKREEKILDNWFNLITVKTFQLFRKYKVN